MDWVYRYDFYRLCLFFIADKSSHQQFNKISNVKFVWFVSLDYFTYCTFQFGFISNRGILDHDYALWYHKKL